MYITIWEFTVRAGAERDFERLYGQDGEWVALFKHAPGFLGTELVRKSDGSRRYLTIDRWESASAYTAFRQAHEQAYRAIDRKGDALTESERPVGEFADA